MVDVINLPPLPGLPDVQLADPATLSAAATALLTADSFAALAALGPPAWGIYSNGAPVVIADTVMEVGYSKGYTVSDFPVEQGAFASFDSVEQPFEGRVRLVAGGSPDSRQAFIESVESVLGDLNTYDLATPDKIYLNANVTREEYKRNSPSLLEIEVGVQEIRILAGTSAGQNTADPASADQQNGGTVQPQDVTSSVQGGTASETAASAQASAFNASNLVTTPLPSTLGGAPGGLPVTNPSSGGIGRA